MKQGAPEFFRQAEAVLREALARWTRSQVAADDVLDALALTWTARRIVSGEAERLPAEPERDSQGLRMEIWG